MLYITKRMLKCARTEIKKTGESDNLPLGDSVSFAASLSSNHLRQALKVLFLFIVHLCNDLTSLQHVLLTLIAEGRSIYIDARFLLEIPIQRVLVTCIV